ncbi:trafficking protein particle complex subunit 8-like isoform X2 [Cucurbita maxima]|uniref:Trafficking protein particle complex subunit 8-like isoform X2 n=1 Tax=Cucurbita maxima TaxID=3661 RepID=A0A6J1IXK6_CUCMA|nr:trafficking protein particle complex subunit 8-like isoform X2 [Cucurbita maxima]
MDPENTPLGRMLLEEITPVIMVLNTPLVEEACLKNGLSFIQMLSPFCSFNNIDVPVRTASDQPYRIKKFSSRLFYGSDIRQPNFEASKERLKQVITQASEKDLSKLCSDPPQINEAVDCFESAILPSWFQLFNKELIRNVSFSEHEAFDHPVACLLVVSSSDDHPVNKFVDLFNTIKLASLLNDDAMDPKIMKHYLLLHDNQDGSSEKASKILTEMRSAFGANDCQLLSINSSHDELIEREDDPWGLFKPDVLIGKQLGCFLSNEDLIEIRELMQDFSSKHIIPYMEQKIRALNQQVSATRKGFRNQIKNLWWRKGKEDTVDSPSGPTYTYNSIESQIRVLGDYAFMLRDYELALSNYRLISTDYKLDKAWKRYAGVQEMMGLTYFLLDQSRKEAEYCMENALNTYLKMGPSGHLNATRCGLWSAEMLKAREQYREAAAVYFRICNEEPLHSAVMLEQASYCYLLSKPPLIRKYGFHLVLSGDRYKRMDQIYHAIRTYRNAVAVFKGTEWSHIKDHVHFHIGQWYASLGLYDVAVTQMLEILDCNHQSKATQELFLKDFLKIIQAGKTVKVLKLPLPKISISSLKVIFDDHRTYASPTAANVRESVWRSLEEDMIPSLSSGRTNWLELQSKIMSKKYKESNICVAGEPVKVNIVFKNPLQIPISISCVSLICDLSSKSDGTKSDTNNITAGFQNNTELKWSSDWEMGSNNASFTSTEVHLSLEGNEEKIVQLTVTPKIEGILQVVGIRWKLSDSIMGFHNFINNLGQKNIAKGRQKVKYSLADNLKFIVIKSLPKLEGSILSLPKVAYAGDLQRLVLELTNQSKFSVKNLKMKISQSRFLKIGKQENMNADFPACLEKPINGEQGVRPIPNTTSNDTFLFPVDTSIQGGTPLLLPLWLRAAVPGNISLYISIYYEMEGVSDIMRYRILRMHYNIQVLPSLDLSFQVNPCPSRLHEFLVRMDVMNKTSSEVFQIHQLSSIGQNWELSLLQPVDNIFPSRALMPNQALSCFFVLKNVNKLFSSEKKVSSVPVLLGSDLKLGSQSSDEQLFDTANFPLAAFHYSERAYQGTSNQDLNTVDFILITRPLKNTTDPGVSESSRLFSHHVCHCSTSSNSPISWLLEGPRSSYHNFSSSFSEINFKMTIFNSSDSIASIRIKTIDSAEGNESAPPSPSSANQTGWHYASLTQDIKVTSDVLGAQMAKSSSLESVSPFIWSGTSSTTLQIEPNSMAEAPLQICIFSPGIYDLSNYILQWKLLPSSRSGNDETNVSSGTCQGYPYYLTVLQSN